jgi:hypothetical protein
MIKKHWKEIIFIICIAVLLTFIINLYLENEVLKDNISKVNNEEKQNNDNKKYSINDFASFEITKGLLKGTSYDEIVKMLGNPAGDMGSGYYIPYYYLEDGNKMALVMYRDVDGKTFYLQRLIIIDKYGRSYIYMDWLDWLH